MTNRRAYSGIFISISLLVLVGTVAAVGNPDTVIITSDKTWIVANNVDQSTITVMVTNTTSDPGPVQGMPVTLVVDPLYGTLSPATVITNAAGMASSTFKVKTKSGTAQINATIITWALSGSIIQNIDHDTPYYDPSFSPPLFMYAPQGTVATEIPFKISMYDRWGNSIDNRRGNHTTGLHVSSPQTPDNCGFNDGGSYQHDISRPLEANGTLTVNVRLTSKIGFNYIRMDSIGAIPFKIVPIQVVAGGDPVKLTGTIYPPEGILPANNIDKFTIEYYLFDIYDNPMANRSILMNTNLTGETSKTEYFSDSNGLIRLYYGPKISLQTANITAIAKDNASVTKNLIAKFINSIPTNMVLGMTPQTMASGDIPHTEAIVRATVIDEFGNPVPNQIVNFSLGSSSHGTYNLTVEPSLSAATATTDSEGNAKVYFHPGSFVKWNETGYSRSATGFVVITAIWNGIPQQVTATWKNYPYLSVIASAEPPNVKLNETVEITIDVIGNGFLMGSRPVVAVLDLDCSASMKNPDTNAPASRLDNAKIAAIAFVDVLKNPPGQNFVGLQSFGNALNKIYHITPVALTDPEMIVTPLISSLKDGHQSKGLAASLDNSIDNITINFGETSNGEVRAVVALNDGNNNIDNQGEMDIRVNHALSHDIRIYMVVYLDGNSGKPTALNKQVIDQSCEIANRTGGKCYIPKDYNELRLDFIAIAHELQEAAGVNAQLDLNFQNVEVNGTSTIGSEVFDYVPKGPFYNLDPTPTSRDAIEGRTRIMWPNSSHSVIDQTEDWYNITPQQLKFNIGTINVSQQWNATYLLRANKTGLINIFNCTIAGSSLTFNNGTENLCLPNLYVTVNPNTTPIGGHTGNLLVKNLVPQCGDFNDSVLVKWDLNYTGDEPTVTETYYYCYQNVPICTPSTGIEFGRSSITSPFTNGWEIPRSHTLDVKKFPSGQFRIKVIASVPGISPAEDSGAFTIPAKTGTINIWLK